MFRVMSPFVINVPTKDGSLHKAVFSNYGWHISITLAKLVNTKHRYNHGEKARYSPTGSCFATHLAVAMAMPALRME